VTAPPPPLPTLLIVYHSATGGTAQMADAARAGAQRAEGLQVRLLHARDAGPDDLLAAQAYLFAMPENLAAIAGVMKDFFDRCYYPVLDRINGRPYALLVCAGSDGSNAVRQAERIATGWRLRKVAESHIVCTHAQTPEAILAPKTIGAADLQACADIGEALGQGLVMGLF
jgi:multimeric flavodoxin WrbA